MPPYEAAFPKRTLVKVVGREALERFRGTWKYHNKLQPEQLEHAERIARVRTIGYYHGGDVLYELEDIPGIWHECCLRSAQ